MVPPLPLWWLMCSTRVGPRPFGAAWWVGPCARTALLGGGQCPHKGGPCGAGALLEAFFATPVAYAAARGIFGGAVGCWRKKPPRWGTRVHLQKARFAKPGVLGASAPVVWPPRGPKPLEHSPCHPGGLPWRRIAPRRWPVGGCTGACDSGCWLGCRLGQVGFGWLTQGAWQGAAGVHWPAMVGKCKPPRWHQTPGIFSGPSWLPVVAETAAQNNTTVWHKSSQLALGLCVPKLGAKCLNAPRPMPCGGAQAFGMAHATSKPLNVGPTPPPLLGRTLKLAVLACKQGPCQGHWGWATAVVMFDMAGAGPT